VTGEGPRFRSENQARTGRRVRRSARNRLIPTAWVDPRLCIFTARIAGPGKRLRCSTHQTIRKRSSWRALPGQPARKSKLVEESCAEGEATLFASGRQRWREVAAQRARQRIQARLKEIAAEEPPIEFPLLPLRQCRGILFVALMRRYGITPYALPRPTAPHPP